MFDPKAVYNFNLEKTLGEKVLVKKCGPAIQKGAKVCVDVDVTNTDRAFGTILGSLDHQKPERGLLDDTVTDAGAGGQSFGAFIPKGLTLNLTGDSNDYFGTGLPVVKLLLGFRRRPDTRQRIISSSVTLLSMARPAELHLSMVLQVSVLQFVTPVQRQ